METCNIVVFFDIGGTLLYSPDIFEIITRKLTGCWPNESTYKRVSETYERMIGLLRQGPPDYPFKNIVELHTDALADLASRYGYPDISVQARDICIDTYVHQSSFFPEAGGVLETLKKHHIRMVIASDNDSLGFNIQIPKFGFDRYFSGYCISETSRAYKPTSGFVDSLKKYLPVDLDDGYFVGDSRVDVESGKRLGIKSVLVDRRKSGDILGAAYVIPDLRGLLPVLGIKE